MELLLSLILCKSVLRTNCPQELQTVLLEVADISSSNLLTDSRISEEEMSGGNAWKAASRRLNLSSSTWTAWRTAPGAGSFSKEELFCRRLRLEGRSEFSRAGEGVGTTGCEIVEADGRRCRDRHESQV
jgi:hypothetical protein